MSKKKNLPLDFDSLLDNAHLPSSKNTLSEAMNAMLEEYVPKNTIEESVHQLENPQTQSVEEKVTHEQKPKKTKPHYHGHRDRLRERVLSNIHRVESYELLELLLGYVHSRKDTKPMSKELLSKFGSLWGMLNAHPTELDNIDDVGPSTKIFFTLIRELIARYFVEPIKAKKSVSIAELVTLAKCMMDGLPHEEIWLALLDNSNRLLGFEQVNNGLVDSVSISPRILAEIAFSKKASAIVLFHNHPGGKLEASRSDIETTKHIHQVLRHMGIRLLEHLILADGQVISFMNNHILVQEKQASFFSNNEENFL